MEPLGPQQYDESASYIEKTAKVSPEYRAQVAKSSIDPAAARDVTAAGYFNDSEGFSAMMNSNGLFAYNQSTNVDFTVTMRTNDGTGSGWVSRDYNDVSKFDASQASKTAIDKAVLSREAKAIEPGKYTVILEPAASAGLLQNMFSAFSARAADEGRNFMSAPDGGNKLGQKIVDERVTFWSDPLHPDVPTAIESGTEWVSAGWRGLTLPKGTPVEIKSTLETACMSIAESNEFKEFMTKNRFGIRLRNAQEFTEFARQQDAQWKTVLEAAGYASP